jgi:Ca2+-binding RTX toxin-like protein
VYFIMPAKNIVNVLIDSDPYNVAVLTGVDAVLSGASYYGGGYIDGSIISGQAIVRYSSVGSDQSLIADNGVLRIGSAGGSGLFLDARLAPLSYQESDILVDGVQRPFFVETGVILDMSPQSDFVIGSLHRDEFITDTSIVSTDGTVDTILGSGGEDYFEFDFSRSASGTTHIADFDRDDRIFLKFAQDGTALPEFVDNFSGKYNEVRYSVSDGKTYLDVDLNGDRQTDYRIIIASSEFVIGSFYFRDENSLSLGSRYYASTVYGTSYDDVIDYYSDSYNDFNIRAEDGNDRLVGGGGNNLLDGGLGADVMVGGRNNDTYIVDNDQDSVIEDADNGFDQVLASVSYVLPGNVENLTLLGALDIDGEGNSLSNVIWGNEGANYLIGGDGDDTLYGLGGDDLLEGGAGNDTLIGGRGGDQMVGGTGDDLYIVDDIRDIVVEAAGEGSDTVQSSVSYTLTDYIENLILTGTLSLRGTGNDLDNSITVNSTSFNTLDGADGNDHLTAGSGGAALIGGAGSDVLTGSASGDALYSDFYEYNGRSWDMGTEKDVLSASGGNDHVRAGYGDDADGGEGSDTLSYSFGGASTGIDIATSSLLSATGVAFGGGTIRNFEMLVALRGSEFNDYISVDTYGTSAPTIDLGAGDDIIIGGAASLLVIGGSGDDYFKVNSINHLFRGGDGSDTIDYSSFGPITVTLGAAGVVGSGAYGYQIIDVENVIATFYNDVITGNELANMLKGGGGADILFGEAGADLLYGEAGNDVLHGGADADTLDGGDGFDTLYGDDGADLLYGGDGNDVLDGGLGADRMVGGAGSDIYIVDNVADVVVEAAGEGLDTVRTSVSYTLADNVEVLQVQDAAAGALVEGRGNGADNILSVNGSVAGGVTIRLFGEGGNDQLVGSARGDYLHGGAGADYMVGGLGDDIYIVDNVGDKVIEAAKGGTDHVQASLSYTLGANVEWLTLLGVDNIRGTGNQLDNIIVGNAGNNVLAGQLGDDTLNGMAGDDILIPDTGNNVVNGGAGNDTLLLLGVKNSYNVLEANGAIYLVGEEGATRMTGVETVRFADGTLATADLKTSLAAFDGLRYAAGSSDLAAAFGTDAVAATNHYISTGFAEGRDAKAFDPLDYIAGYRDLITAFGTDGAAATRHYLTAGQFEGRTDEKFSGLDYAASYPTLAAQFGADEEAAARHYILTGRAQGLSDSGFDALQYAASYKDLAALFGTDTDAATRHYLQFGRAEGRSADAFDGLRYVASNADLIVAIGSDDDGAAAHFLRSGFAENRPTSSFDALKYAAANPDVAAAFGTDVEALTEHYIDHGYYEHRPLAPAAAMVEVIG